MIVLDTNVLAYAVGSEHALREPCRAIVRAIESGRVEASTTSLVIQEFVHVRSRRTSRLEAAATGRAFVTLLSPLVPVRDQDVVGALSLFETHPGLDAFDALLAAATLASGAEALVSNDQGYASVTGLRSFAPGSPELSALL